MLRSRKIASVLMALVGAGMVAAGPVMVYEGVHGQSMIKDELRAQKIEFPADKAQLPDDLKGYAGRHVTTGSDAKAYADLIATHIAKATGGRTYSEVSDEWIAGGRKDEQLAQTRQTAFMGETLRGSLMSAYQAEQVTWLVSGLGALFVALGAVFGVTAFSLRTPKVVVPASPEALASGHLPVA
ncbi:hypothetical protein [Actinoplanes sp. NPDC049316]|uniref:hypothetical protein n=1 Tax=Actinoplanes sp. NPDC049316 TaxID=3154727 RepID=UPI003432C7B0